MATSSIPQSGIYIIKNVKNGNFYIGQAQNIHVRWIYHRRDLRGAYHKNAHLQAAWNKYGEKAFKFLVLERCPVEQLDEREQHYLDTYVGNKNCYNMAKDAISPMRGRKASASTRQKLSAAHRGNKVMCGRKLSDETRQKLSEINRGQGNGFFGRTHSEESIRKMADAHRGKTHSEETRQKISEAARNVSDEVRQKISNTHRGKPKSAEQRQKMSEAQKQRRLRERNHKE